MKRERGGSERYEEREGSERCVERKKERGNGVRERKRES